MYNVVYTYQTTAVAVYPRYPGGYRPRYGPGTPQYEAGRARMEAQNARIAKEAFWNRHPRLAAIRNFVRAAKTDWKAGVPRGVNTGSPAYDRLKFRVTRAIDSANSWALGHPEFMKSLRTTIRNTPAVAKAGGKAAGIALLGAAVGGAGLGLLAWRNRVAEEASLSKKRRKKYAEAAMHRVIYYAKKSNPVVDQAFHEVFHNVPKNVTKTKKTGEAKRKMMVAIALSKARARGAKV